MTPDRLDDGLPLPVGDFARTLGRALGLGIDEADARYLFPDIDDLVRRLYRRTSTHGWVRSHTFERLDARTGTYVHVEHLESLIAVPQPRIERPE